MMKPSPSEIERLVRIALEEDAPWGDITSQSLIPADALVPADLVAREPGVLCGEDIFIAAMSLTDPAISTTFRIHDGSAFSKGDILATIEGSARGALQAERVALNFTQRLCGIATLTAKYVAATSGTKARIADTRKTTPGLRLLERYAVRCGGGTNHRFSLSDAVMAKDNHLAVLGTTLDQIDEVLAAGVDTIMLDNFATADLRAGVEKINGRALVEASGGITLERIREIAETGVDIISVGALTHSVRALDLGLDFRTP